MRKILAGIIIGLLCTLVSILIIAYKYGKLSCLRKKTSKTKYVRVNLDR